MELEVRKIERDPRKVELDPRKLELEAPKIDAQLRKAGVEVPRAVAGRAGGSGAQRLPPRPVAPPGGLLEHRIARQVRMGEQQAPVGLAQRGEAAGLSRGSTHVCHER